MKSREIWRRTKCQLFLSFSLSLSLSTTCEQAWICTVCVGRGKHVIFNSRTEKFWERRVVEIANDYHLSLLTNFGTKVGSFGIGVACAIFTARGGGVPDRIS